MDITELKYKVIKPIPKENSWEVGAEIGDILTVRNWNSCLTLMKDDKAVCDLDSQCQKECTELYDYE